MIVSADDSKGSAGGTFTGRIELLRQFKGMPEIVDAEVTYRLRARGSALPVFISIKVDGALLPLSMASESSLLLAYSKHHAASRFAE